MTTENYSGLLNQAEQAFANQDTRKGMAFVLQILNKDFTNDPAWQTLYRIMQVKQPFEVFQMELAIKYFPDKVHLLMEKELANLLPGVSPTPKGNPPLVQIQPTPNPPAAVPPPSTNRCPHCGKPIFREAAFCGYCGGRVSLPPQKTNPKAETPKNGLDLHQSRLSGDEKNRWLNRYLLPILIAIILLLLLLISPLNILVVLLGILALGIFFLQKFKIIGGQNILLAIWQKYIQLFNKLVEYIKLLRDSRPQHIPPASNIPDPDNSPQVKTKPRFGFIKSYFLAELGLVLLIISYYIPWWFYAQGNILPMFNSSKVFYARTLMENHGTAGLDRTVLIFYILTCFAYILSHSRISVMALIAGIGALGFQIYNLNVIVSSSNLSQSDSDPFFQTTINTRMGDGAYVALAAVVLILIGVVVGMIAEKRRRILIQSPAIPSRSVQSAPQPSKPSWLVPALLTGLFMGLILCLVLSLIGVALFYGRLNLGTANTQVQLASNALRMTQNNATQAAFDARSTSESETISRAQKAINPTQTSIAVPRVEAVPVKPTPLSSPPEYAVLSYWELVSSRNYLAGWNMLSPHFQSGKHQSSSANYVNGYNQMNLCSVTAQNIRRVSIDGNSAVVTATLVYRTGSNCASSQYNLTFSMIYDSGTDQWWIDSVQ